jgi:hypothetical protein
LPTSTDFNTATTISGVGRIGWIVASLDHCAPRSIFAGYVTVTLICITVLEMKTSISFSLITATGVRVSGLKIVAESNNLIAALADARPDDATLFNATGNAEYKQTTETLSCDVN